MPKLVLAAIFTLLAIPSFGSESMRCGTQLIDVGATKAELLEICGDPQMVDHYCKSTYMAYRREITKFCEDVELWTYNFGRGTFFMNVEFREGRISDISHGERVD